MAVVPVRVFISYAHESDAHVEAVRDLWIFLRAHGVDAQLDRVAAQRRQDWPLWMMRQVRDSDHVLVVASEAYKRRAEGDALPDEGRGVQFEAALIRDAYYSNQQDLDRFVPVVLPDGSKEHVPAFLMPNTTTVYQVSEFSLAGADELLRLLLDQPGEVEPKLGQVPNLGAGSPALAPPSLRHEVEVEVRPGDSGGLVTRTLLGGTLLGERSAAIPIDLLNIWQALEGGHAEERLTAAGHSLRRALFDEATVARLVELAEQSPFGTVVDLSVRLHEAVLQLPMELLRWPAGQLVATTGNVTFVRRLAGVDGRATAASPGPLKILAAVAAPDETKTQSAPLDVEAEMQAILDAVTELGVAGDAEVRILEVASPQAITAALAADQYHVLHLSAHGSPGGVELQDEDGNSVPVDTSMLVTMLRAGRHPLPVVVLSSCSGGAAGADGLAATLIRHGADRVVAMQTSVTDAFATDLVRQLYRVLASDATATVGMALTEARRWVHEDYAAVVRKGGAARRPEYAVPTLFAVGDDLPLRDPDGEAVPLSRPTLPPADAVVRELPLGDLIGRRAELRQAMAALRGGREDREKVGAWSGVVLTGVGGIGKTALAGRARSRLRADGWWIAEHHGTWSPPALTNAVAEALDGTSYANLAEQLRHPQVDDAQKLRAVMALLKRERLLVLFDDFEQNLSPADQSFLDPGFAEIFHALVDAADAGRLLVTSRYPIPDADTLLRVPLPALSPSELRRLLLRMPALRELGHEDRRLIIRTVGGHPRLIEFIDVLLRQGQANFLHITRKLRDLARHEQIDLTITPTVEQGVAHAVLLGSRDIILDLLYDGLTPDQRELLLQAAISTAALTCEDLTHTRHADATTEQRHSIGRDIEVLRDLTLLSTTPAGDLTVHPWVAHALAKHQHERDLIDRHRRGADMRLERFRQGRGAFDDAVDLVRHLALSRQHDSAVGAALQVCSLLSGDVAVSAFLAETVALIPSDHPRYLFLADRECQALLNVGLVTATTQRRYHLLAVAQSRADHDPGNAGYQRDLGISRERLGDLAVAAGDGAAAAEHYAAGLAISERLAAGDPGNAGYQRDLSISRNKLGDLARVAGDGAAAAEHYAAGLAIRERLAAGDPGNAEYQRDLSPDSPVRFV